jgi:dihydropteroate synthase
VDPGVGFGKSVEDNLALIRHLGVLRSLACPILVGLSRKSFLGPITGREVGDRREGTVAAETVAALAGAEIIRTHEPAAARDAIRVARAVAGFTD